MRDFHAIINELKLLLADGKKIKILDKDVANLLDISQSKFATIKKRNVIPYENILVFCEREGRSCCEVFFEKK